MSPANIKPIRLAFPINNPYGNPKYIDANTVHMMFISNTPMPEKYLFPCNDITHKTNKDNVIKISKLPKTILRRNIVTKAIGNKRCTNNLYLE